MPSELINEKLPAEVLSKMASFRESGTFCDVILEADSSSKDKSEPTSSTSVRAHKLVLAAASPYFRETLSRGSFVDSKEIRIVVEDIDGKTLRVLVDYMYTGSLNINEKNVRVLFAAAEILHLDFIRSECSSVLVGVRLPLMSREFLLDRVYNEPMRIMVAGGAPDIVSRLADVNIYDPYSQQWTSAASLLRPRRDFGMATVGDSMLLVEQAHSMFFDP
ncbi:unnamed protein product [Nippostrongylus brasiliensis]|uniref:BTB domain-containing protein n=1 Tax=Nippostrongylus brasiliensis TaxID=27835 RepID=A0A0N4Y9N8_NIPBR|nr:unnamed protein product [Nippostrongylus brasiliensis]